MSGDAGAAHRSSCGYSFWIWLVFSEMTPDALSVRWRSFQLRASVRGVTRVRCKCAMAWLVPRPHEIALFLCCCRHCKQRGAAWLPEFICMSCGVASRIWFKALMRTGACRRCVDDDGRRNLPPITCWFEAPGLSVHAPMARVMCVLRRGAMQPRSVIDLTRSGVMHTTPTVGVLYLWTDMTASSLIDINIIVVHLILIRGAPGQGIFGSWRYLNR